MSDYGIQNGTTQGPYLDFPLQIIVLPVLLRFENFSVWRYFDQTFPSGWLIHTSLFV